MLNMKLPRFSLRTLFVLITLISIPIGWVAYQLNWIRQRHKFARKHTGGILTMFAVEAVRARLVEAVW